MSVGFCRATTWGIGLTVILVAWGCAPAGRVNSTRPTSPTTSTAGVRPSPAPDPTTKPAEVVVIPTPPPAQPVTKPVPVAVPAPADPWPVPDGRFIARLRAKGVQIYRAQDRGDGVLVWKWIGPEATLSDATGQTVGKMICKGEAVSWEAEGGTVTGRGLRERPSPNSEAVPEVQYGVTGEGQGIFSNAGIVEQLLTAGGQAPAEGPPVAGAEVRSPYSAEYIFYAAAE